MELVKCLHSGSTAAQFWPVVLQLSRLLWAASLLQNLERSRCFQDTSCSAAFGTLLFDPAVGASEVLICSSSEV